MLSKESKYRSPDFYINYFVVSALHRKVIMNLYRKKYGIPGDLRVRKPDADIRMAVHDSEAIRKLELMLE